MHLRFHIALAASLTLLASPAAFAGEIVADGKSKIVEEPCPPDGRLLLKLSSGYVFESDFERGRDASGDAWSKEFKAGYRIPMQFAWPNEECGQWYFRLGANYTRWDFNNKGALPIPNTLQSAAGVIALEYLVRGETGILFETEPGMYFEHDINTGAFDAPTKVAAAFKLARDFYLVGGVSYSALRTYPFIPILGVYWRINDQWMLKAIPPEPRLFYQASEKLSLWVGGELAGGSFKTDNWEVPRKEKLSGAVVSYSEYRAGAGFTYDCHGAQLEVGAGWVFQRKFDFHRAEEGFETDEGAPYLKVAINASF